MKATPSDVIILGWGDLGIALMIMVGLIALDRVLRLYLGKDMAVGTVRNFLQLYLVGFILKWVFHINHPLLILLMLVVMTLIAGQNAAKRSGDLSLKTFVYASGILFIGTMVTIVVVVDIVVGVTPYYNPQYVIPMFGMALNGAMNGVTLGVKNLRNSTKDNVEKINCALALGATGSQSINPIAQSATRLALIPMVNGLMTAGVVQLPGMMTGQIIAGLDPTLAIRYQIVVYYMLAMSTFLCTVVAVKLYARTLFTRHHQLIPFWSK